MRLFVLIFLILFICGAGKYDQTNQLYSAETVLINQKGSVFLKTRKEVVNYLNFVFNDSWFVSNFKISKPIIIKSEMPNWAYSIISGSGNRIAVPDTGCWNFNLLHEIAHLATPHANHNKNFAKVELLLIEHFMSTNAANTLKESFKKNNVKF
jgi:cytochrome b subunit of formate dehydrogenase